MEEVKKLYTALIGKGYTANDLGSEDVFAKKMQDEQNRRELYDYVSSRGDFKIGSYDNYEQRLRPAQVQKSQPVVDAYGMPTQPEVSTIEDAPKIPQVNMDEFTVNETYLNNVADNEGAQASMEGVELKENLKSDLFKPQSTETPSLLDMGSKPKDYFAEAGAKAMEGIRQDRQAREYQEIMKPYTSSFGRKKEHEFINTAEGYNQATRIFGGEEANRRRDELNEQARPWMEAQKTWSPSSARRFREQTIGQTWHDPYAVVPEEYKALATQKWGKEGSEDAYFSAWMNLSPEERGAFVRREHIKSFFNEETANRMQGIRERALEEKGRGIAKSAMSPMGYNNSAEAAMDRMVQDAGNVGTQTLKALDKAEEIKQAYKNHQLDENFFAGAYKGMKDGLTDIDNWTGLYMVGEMNNLYDIADKIEKGEALSQTEEDFLDAQAYKLAVEAALADDLGWGYGSGNVTGASVPFMLQMLVSPMSGASGKAIDKGFAAVGRRAIDKFGKGILKKLLTKAPVKKVVKGLAGTVGKGIGQTILFGSDRVAAGTMERHLGNEMVAERANEEFNAGVQGKAGEDLGTALFKAGVSTSMENISEFAGGAFIDDFTKMAGKKIAKEFTDAMGGSVGSSLMRAATNTRAGKALQNLANAKVFTHGANLAKSIERGTEWDGLLNEYLEEVLNNASNVMIGDMTMEDFTSLEKNAETVLGLAWTSGFFMASNAASRIKNYVKGSSALKRTERAARQVFEGEQEKWDAYTQALSQTNGYEEAEALYTNFMDEIAQEQDKELARARMNEATAYMVSYVQMMGMNASTEEAEKEEEKTPAQQDMETALGEGLASAGTAQELDIVDEMEESALQLSAHLQKEDIDQWLLQFGETADMQLQAIRGSELDEQTKAVAETYLASAQRYEGVLLANQEEIDAKVEEAARDFDANVNQELGSVIEVLTPKTKDTEGKRAYVIQGNPEEAGTITLRYEDGTTEQTTRAKIAKIVSNENAEAIRPAVIEGVRRTAVAEVAGRMNEHVPNAAETAMFAGHNVIVDGQPGVVADMNQDGTLKVQMQDGKTISAAPQQVMDAQAYNNIMERKARAREGVMYSMPVREEEEAEAPVPVEELTEAQMLLQEYMDESVPLEDRMAIVGNNVAQAKQAAIEAQAEVDAMTESKPKATDYTSIAEFKQAQEQWKAQMQEKQQVLDLARQQEVMWDEVQRGIAQPAETAGIFKTSYDRNRKEVYHRHTTEKQSTETAGVSQGIEQSGTQMPSSMNTPTSSASKDTQSVSTEQTDKKEISEKSAESNVEVAKAEAKNHNSKHDIKALAKEIGASKNRIQRVMDFANQIGVKLNFANVTRTQGNAGALTNADNIASKREITLSKYMLAKGLPIEWVMGHELTHQIKADGKAENWEAYKQAIKGLVGENTFDALVAQQAEVYRKAGAYKDMPADAFMDAMEEEVCADTAGSVFLNPSNISKVMGVPQSLASRIWNALKNMVGLGTPKSVLQAVDAWQQLAEGKELTGEAADRERHSIVSDKAGAQLEETANATRYSIVVDPQLIAELEASPKRMGYRNVVQREDGLFEAPMGNSLRGNGITVENTPFAMGQWEQSEEHPELVYGDNKITLVKPDGKTVADVNYNPYIHNRLNTLNAQFKQAWERPDLVYVETEVPVTDLEGGYMAEHAHLSTGVHQWSNGALMLSRYDKPVRIVPWDEVAIPWIEKYKKSGVHFDIVPPALRPILTEAGVEIKAPHKGMGENCIKAYEEWKAEQEVKKFSLVDYQGNPLNDDGTLALERVSSIAELTDNDFEESSRSIILPKLPENVDKAIGAGGKDVIIKKNIFERNYIRHSELTPDNSREILQAALYSPNIYGQNQKSKRPKNWVVISVASKSGANKLVLLEISDNKEFVEIVHWHYIDQRGIEKIKRQAGREGGQLLILPSASTEEVGALSDLTTNLSSASKDTQSVSTEQTDKKEISEKGAESNVEVANEEVMHSISPIEGYTYSEVIDMVQNDVENILSEEGADNIEAVEFWAHGSRMRGNAKEDSDLDVVMFYKGNEKEDSLFNLINGHELAIDGIKVDVNPIRVSNEQDIARYKEKSARYDQEMRFSLAGLHNISEEKLKKAIKQGGLANPSVAVIDLDTRDHNTYGDITLVLPSYMIDKKQGRNAGTYMGDAWTPTYPRVSMRLDNKGWRKIDEFIASISDDAHMRSNMHYAVEDFMQGGTTPYMQYAFLRTKGIEIPFVYKNNDRYISNEEFKELIGMDALTAFNGSLDAYNKFKELPKEVQDELYVWIINRGDKAKIKAMKESIQKDQRYANLLDYEVPFSKFNMFANDTFRREQDNGKIDYTKTFSEANNHVATNGLGAEYNAWISNLLEEAGAEEYIFAGFTPSGNAKYLPHTLENVSKVMKKDGKSNAYNNTGYGPTRAGIIKALSTLGQIRKNSDTLRTDINTVDEAKEELTERLYELRSKLADMRKLSDNPFINGDYAESRLQEALSRKNPARYLNEEYGYNIEEDGDFAKKLESFIDDVRKAPVRYFETKFERPVMLDEFHAAVIPNDTDTEVVKALEKAGLNVETYERDNDAERKEALLRASDEHVRFSLTADILAANERFNEELDALTQENADRMIFDLGTPSAYLKSAGVHSKPMKLYGSKIIKKQKKHGFRLEQLRNLPIAIADPIAVFDNHDEEGNRAILTELNTDAGNILVAISLGKGADIDFNIISSAFGKDTNKIVNWINKGFGKYYNKEKALEYLHLAAPIAAASDNQELSDATKIVQDFQNPPLPVDESLQNVENATSGEQKYSLPGRIPRRRKNESLMDYANRIADILYAQRNATRDWEFQEPAIALARDKYEDRVSSGWYQTKEALQDSMLGLKVFMESVLGKGTYIEDVAGVENAYLGENRLSSVNFAEASEFARLVFKPMLEEVAKLAKNDIQRQMLVDYMMAKHGLERNRVMAEKDAQAEAKENQMMTLDELRAKYRNKDYAGLTALTNKQNIRAAEAEAQAMVDAYESTHDTSALWDKVMKTNTATLTKMRESGLLSQEMYDNIANMYEFYIPLRGFDEKTSDEAYAYLSHKDSAFNAPIRRAKGRKSKADDPFAQMQAMAESAIMQGNRNLLVKQKLLNFVQNHPSDLATVSEMWISYDAVNKEWTQITATISPTDTPADVARKTREFNETMEELHKLFPGRYQKAGGRNRIPYKVIAKNLSEHQVIVKRNGVDYVITINGSPRAAQAVNGMTNPDSGTGAVSKLFEYGEKVNRVLSGVYTSYNPDFLWSNFIRDTLYTNTMSYVKESPAWAFRFNRNFLKFNPATMARLLSKWDSGKLDMNDKTEALFYQFMKNGGETGYANIRNIEQHKSEIKEALKKANGRISTKLAWDAVKNKLEFVSRAAENGARFAAFATSMQMGRGVERAIYDAKEVSVNFNKKGSGATFMGTTGQTTVGNAAAFTSGLGRSLYVFWNAAIQGSTNFGRQVKRHPVRALTVSSVMFGLGVLMSMIGGDDEDDENAFYNLPENIRRTNIMMRFGNHWLTLPLPVEYRAMYGMGQLAGEVLSGKSRMSDWELGMAIAQQVSQMAPIDVLGAGGGWNAFTPSWAKPVTDAYVLEKNWAGQPLYKDWDTYAPEWTKAYDSADQNIVGFTRWLNEATGGNVHRKGRVDLNPAKIEAVIDGYFGGISALTKNFVKTGEMIFGDRDYQPRNIPLLRRIVYQGDERTAYRRANEQYRKYKEDHDELQREIRGYEGDMEMGTKDWTEELDRIYNSPEIEQYYIMDWYGKDISKLSKQLNETTDEEEKDAIRKEINLLKSEAVREIENLQNKKEK